MRTLRSILLGALLCAGSGFAFAGAVVSGFNSNTLAANDDGYTGLVNIGFTVNFFGSNYSQLYVNNNGNLTFDAALSTYTPFNLYNAGRVMIAPFFGDVDTRGTGSGLLRYGPGTFDGHTAFGATWDGTGVGYFSDNVDKLNKFQTLLVDRADTGAGNFDIYFNYDQIQWETGDVSGGTNGLGGDSARAGYSNGTPAYSYELPGSGVNGGLLDSNLVTGLIHSSNIGVPGRDLFTVRNGQVIIPPPPAGVPDTASTVSLLCVALVAFAAIRRKLARA